MTHLAAHPHPKSTPKISKQIITLQENLTRTYEILSSLYQFPDQALNIFGISEQIIDLNTTLEDFDKETERLIRLSPQEEFLFSEDFAIQNPTDSINNLNDIKKEARRAKKLTNQLTASFCKIRLGINDFNNENIHAKEISQLCQDIGSTVSDLFSEINIATE